MLFTPVPESKIYEDYLSIFRKYGWNQDLHKLNGKWYPFLEINGYSIITYENIERLMFSLNCNVKGKSFDLLGNKLIEKIFRKKLCEIQEDNESKKENLESIILKF
jgi:hypothetical protein